MKYHRTRTLNRNQPVAPREKRAAFDEFRSETSEEAERSRFDAEEVPATASILDKVAVDLEQGNSGDANEKVAGLFESVGRLLN